MSIISGFPLIKDSFVIFYLESIVDFCCLSITSVIIHFVIRIK